MSQAIVQEFDPLRVRPLPGQPRKRFRGIAELAASIAEVGQLQAGIVTRVVDDADFDAELVDGERRKRACEQAGRPFRAEVRGLADAEQIFATSFAANFGKQDHDALEIAEALDRLRSTKTIEQLARIAGRSTAWVSQHVSLLKLHPDVRALMVVDDVHDAPRLTFSLALLLAQAGHDAQIRLAKKIVKGEGMSMTAARRMVLAQQPAGLGEQRGRRTIATLDSILADTIDRIGVYLDMSRPALNAVIDGVDKRAKRQLIERLTKLSDDLIDLADEIEKRIVATAAAKK